MRPLLKILLSLSLLLTNGLASATSIVAWNIHFHLFASSKDVFKAHRLYASSGIYDGNPHPVCGYDIYIPFSDKEMFATVLTANAMKRRVNVEYEDSAAPKDVYGHAGLTCKAKAIWLSTEPE
jgi:hypothetical protein